MIIFKEITPLKEAILQFKSKGKSIGFVPTMGALHSGHLSLIKESLKSNNITLASIFVNPAQFNDQKDFEKYPVTIENDIFLLEQVKADVLFLPSVSEIYPEGLSSPVEYGLGYLETILEGFYRPGHFQGVCRVVHRLLDIIKPDNLFLGQKDYQQCMVVSKLLNDFSIPTRLNIVSTERETSGLAMSSRNLRLSLGAKQKASAIYDALNFIKKHIADIPYTVLKKQALSMITDAGFEKIDYLEICDATTLMPFEDYNKNNKTIALAAAFTEGVRLIDNLLIN